MRIIIIIIIIVLSNLNLSYSQSLNDNLLIHYSFTNNANDLSGNNFNGIPNATLTSDIFGNPNSAYSFNGQDEYIDFPNNNELKPQLPVSFYFWVKLDNIQPENTVLFTTDFDEDNHSGVWMNLSSTGRISINYGDATGNTTSANRRSKTGLTILSANEWYHIVGIIKDFDDMEIFINCTNDDGTYSGSGGDLGYSSNSGSIGRKDANTNLPAYYLKGVLDDFRYWNRELNTTEINTLCNQSTLSTPLFQSILNKTSILSNPVSDLLQIKTSEKFESIKIYNSMGILVHQEKFNTNMNVEFLNPGFYILKLTNNSTNNIFTTKFIKK